mgnify:FL=1|tara:strand:- start:12996 stop:13481 length:486 start_codon:yes stop_codon:yes gene_type:complete
MSLVIRQADYENPADGAAIVALLDAYARDPMGGGEPLKAATKDTLVSELAKRPFALSILAFSDDEPVGLINAFEAFSTFKAAPILNLHDIAVLPHHRSKGIARKMMQKAEDIARERGCCKLTLEVLSGNATAITAYRNFGFDNYQLDPEAGTAQFMEKPLS